MRAETLKWYLTIDERAGRLANSQGRNKPPDRFSEGLADASDLEPTEGKIQGRLGHV